MIATSDGGIRILDKSLNQSNHPFDTEYQLKSKQLISPLNSPSILPSKERELLKIYLQHGKYDQLTNFPIFSSNQSLQLPSAFLASLKKEESLQNRCLLIAKYFCNDDEVDFWSLVIYSFHSFKNRRNKLNLIDLGNTFLSNSPNLAPNNLQTSSSSVGSPENNAFGLISSTNSAPVDLTGSLSSLGGLSISQEGVGKKEEQPEASKEKEPLIKGLLPHFDLLRDSECCRKEFTEKSEKLKNYRQTQEMSKQNIDLQICLHKYQDAIDSLLSTPPNDNKFLQDSLFACVIAAAQSKETYFNTVRRVANEFIAQKQIKEGIQLLLLINRGLEACEFLQNAGKYEEAAYLAKVLPFPSSPSFLSFPTPCLFPQCLSLIFHSLFPPSILFSFSLSYSIQFDLIRFLAFLRFFHLLHWHLL